MPYSMKSDRNVIRAGAVAVLAGLTVGVLATISCQAQAGSRSELEPKAQAVPYLHAASTKVSKGKDRELTVKGDAGTVKAQPAPKADLVDRKSKN